LLAALCGLTKGLLCATTMEILEKRREQNSGNPLHGVVFVGRGRAAVVASAVPLMGALAAGKPAIAVRSSVVDEALLEEVAVTLLAPEMTVAGNVLGKEAALGVAELLGIGEADNSEVSCAERHRTSKIQGIRIVDVEDSIWTVVEI
jgi:hypothetical protein